MASFATMLHGVNIDLGFIYVSLALDLKTKLTRQNMTGIFTGSALPPLVATFFSSRQGSLAAVSSIWGGFIAAVVVWLSLTQRFSGTVTIATVGALDPCLYGCLAGIGASALITFVISLVYNANYQWDTLKAVRLVDDDGKERDVTANDTDYDPVRLRRAAYLARGITLFLFLALFIIWPLSMYGSGYIFSKLFFRGWTIVSLLWAFAAIFAVSIFPIIEGRHTLIAIVRSGLRWRPGQGDKADVSDGSLTPTAEKGNEKEDNVI
jgi:hypothetical protein